MNKAKTKDGALFEIGMLLVTDQGVQFSTKGYELELAGGHWALFRPNANQGFKLDSYYSSPTAYYADKLSKARVSKEFWTLEELRFQEFIEAEILIEKPVRKSDV